MAKSFPFSGSNLKSAFNCVFSNHAWRVSAIPCRTLVSPSNNHWSPGGTLFAISVSVSDSVRVRVRIAFPETVTVTVRVGFRIRVGYLLRPRGRLVQ